MKRGASRSGWSRTLDRRDAGRDGGWCGERKWKVKDALLRPSGLSGGSVVRGRAEGCLFRDFLGFGWCVSAPSWVLLELWGGALAGFGLGSMPDYKC